MSGRLPVNVEREARESLRNALLVLLNAISEDKGAINSLIERDPQAFKQAIEALMGEDLSPYFKELLVYFDRRLPEHCQLSVHDRLELVVSRYEQYEDSGS